TTMPSHGAGRPWPKRPRPRHNTGRPTAPRDRVTCPRRLAVGVLDGSGKAANRNRRPNAGAGGRWFRLPTAGHPIPGRGPGAGGGRECGGGGERGGWRRPVGSVTGGVGVSPPVPIRIHTSGPVSVSTVAVTSIPGGS